jgi:gliding motility-associated-like protein
MNKLIASVTLNGSGIKCPSQDNKCVYFCYSNRLYIKYIVFYIALFFGILFQVSGQQQAVDACFTLNPNKTRICVGEAISVINCISPPNGSNTPDKAFFYFNDPDAGLNVRSPEVVKGESISHTYNKPGVYAIKQVGGIKAPLPGQAPELDDSIIYVTVLNARTPVFETNLCEDYNVTFTILDTFFTEYFLRPQPGSSEISFLHDHPYKYKYTSSISNTATIRGECGQGADSKFTPISALIKPDLQSIIVNDVNGVAKVQLKFDAVGVLRYKILQQSGTGSFISIDTVSGKTGATELEYNVPVSGACYRIAAFDYCGNADTSEVLCIDTLNVTAVNNQNLIVWSASPYMAGNIKQYELYRNGKLLLRTPSASILNYTDTYIACGRTYSYFLKTISKKNNATDGTALSATSQSKTAIAKSDSKPPSVLDLQATVTQSGINLSWNKPESFAVKAYTISRSEGNMAYQKHGLTTTNIYTDVKADFQNQRYCYKVSYTDSCSNVADDSLIVCPVLLKVTKDQEEKNINHWFNYFHTGNIGNSYVLERLDESNKIIAAFLINDTLYSDGPLSADLPLVKYRIKTLIDGNASDVSYSNVVTLKNELILFLPDAFTPNNDDVNDQYHAFGKYLKDFKLSIFNRWGELIYYSEDINEKWDGKYKGQPANIDTYVYIVTAKNNAGEEILKKGSLILLR